MPVWTPPPKGAAQGAAQEPAPPGTQCSAFAENVEARIAAAAIANAFMLSPLGCRKRQFVIVSHVAGNCQQRRTAHWCYTTDAAHVRRFVQPARGVTVV